MNIKDFWRTLDSQTRDRLRDKLAKGLFLAVNTIDSYGYGTRVVPERKRDAYRQIVNSMLPNQKITF